MLPLPITMLRAKVALKVDIERFLSTTTDDDLHVTIALKAPQSTFVVNNWAR